MESSVIIFITWVLIIIGLAGTIIPGLPGMGLIFGGILLYAMYFGVESVGMTTLIFLGAATALSFVLDLLAGLYGAKHFGATRSGIIGSVVGGIVGFVVMSLPGLFFGMFLGAVSGEYFLAKKNGGEALKVGLGSVLGFLAGALLKFLLGLVLVFVFIAKTWF